MSPKNNPSQPPFRRIRRFYLRCASSPCSDTSSSTRLDSGQSRSSLAAVIPETSSYKPIFHSILFFRALRSWTSAGGDVDGQLVVMVLQLHDRHDLSDASSNDGCVRVHHLLDGLLSADGAAEVLHAGDARQGHFRDRSARFQRLPLSSSGEQSAPHRCLLNASNFL